MYLATMTVDDDRILLDVKIVTPVEVETAEGKTGGTEAKIPETKVTLVYICVLTHDVYV